MLGTLLSIQLTANIRNVYGMVSILQPQNDIVILSDPTDPYYPLAEEIAGAEEAPLTPDLETALAYKPVFLLWVASPQSFSDQVLVEFGLTMKEQPSVISTGIISGSTIENARKLWARRDQARSQVLFAVNAPNPSARILEGRITEFAKSHIESTSLTKMNFITALQSADYLTFTGHGGNSYLGLEEGLKISPSDIPLLGSSIVATGSCQTFRPWRENNIALRFVDQGAIAYSGFAFSPNEGYLLGEFDGLPFRYTWQDYPIGHVIQAQNRGTLQGFAHFPFQFLLGDPRIFLQAEPPYRIVDDLQQGNERILKLQDVPAGVIPIRIAAGADYRFVKIPGVTTASERDPFYNSRLQMVDIENDKLILLFHEGGDLTIRLRKQPPLYWFPVDILLDSLDHTFIFSQQASGDLLSLGFSVIPLLWVIWQIIKRRFNQKQIVLATILGAAASALQAIYVLTRLDNVTIISKDVASSPVSLIATFILTSCGALIFSHARSQIGKFIAIAVATFTSWTPMLFGLLILAVMNLLFAVPELGTPLYNYSLGLLSVASFITNFSLFGLALKLIKRYSQ